MLIVNLAGGLGNQMFQYAMGFSLAARTGLPIVYSTTFSQYEPSQLTIDRVFNLQIQWCDDSVLESCLGKLASSPFARRLLGKVSELTKRQLWGTIRTDTLNGYNEIDIPNLPLDYYIHGYWQSEHYFLRDFDQLKEQFIFNETRSIYEISEDLFGNKEKIGVHIRRGDYISNSRASKKLGTQVDEYYVNGSTKLRRMFAASKIIVFSDDIRWAEGFLSPLFDDIYFSNLTGSSASSDIQMLSQCDHFVLSNSTFGWWAAYLCNNPRKVVMTPKKWFADGTSDKDIIPVSWIDSQKYVNKSVKS